MISSKTLKSMLERSYSLLSVSPDNFELLRKKIYEISMHALLQDVLTLARMRSVIQTINMGVIESAQASTSLADENAGKAQRSACQGLCSAAGLGLSAAGIAFTQFSKFHGSMLPPEIGQALVLETQALKNQIDQVTRCAGWLTDPEVIRLQAHGFGQLMQPFDTGAKQADESLISWSDRFFQTGGYQPVHAKSNAHASLMLLGLLTSGALIGLLDVQAAA
jgi:hypothetical protein